ncbi:hypothetical protein [Kitasatospora sp. NBC_00315]|uniref:hypothetical protein n=1 Tax=Kitasatospora sp. NBC_00315 TaxID=2975963 RepID=UPI00324A3F98
MQPVSYLSIGTATTACIGTWLVGVVAGIIAIQQLRNASFLPCATAGWEIGWQGEEEAKNRRMVVIHLTNHGGAAGMVERIVMTDPDHDVIDATICVGWEEAPQQPLPFILPGKSSAVIVLKPSESPQFVGNRRALVIYGNGKKKCLPMKKVELSLSAEKTTIPPGALVNTGSADLGEH